MGASQGLLLFVVILSLRSENPASSYYLALFVGMESLHLFCLYWIYSHISDVPTLPLRLLFGIRVFSAPSLYLYVCAMTGDAAISPRRLLIHAWVLLPLLAWFGVLSVDDNWASQSALDLQRELSTVLFAMFVSVLIISYSWAAYWCLDQHSFRLEQALSAVDQGDLRWLRWLIAAMISAHCCFLVLDSLRLSGAMGPEVKITLNVITTILLIYLVSIGGLRQPTVFTQSVQRALAAMDGTTGGAKSREKYAKSGMVAAKIEEIWERLGCLMAQEQPYLDYALDLPKLAKMLNVSPQELSQVINTASEGTFYQLISRQRINAAKQVLADSGQDHLKILDVALAVGFSNQSTFYSQFKKLTGMTPVAYRSKAEAQRRKAR